VIRTKRIEVADKKLTLKVNTAAMEIWHLSKRETSIAQLMFVGKGPQETGEILFISPKTVSTYRTRLLEKAGVDNWEELIYLATKIGVLFTEEQV
jgi:DNA-binding CsgD family transcriptional regulator